MRGLFNIPNLFTSSNLLCGVIAIIFAFIGKLDWACYSIFLGAIFDFFDGFLARKLKIAGEIGKQLDSLADMVTFGVAPGIITFILLILGGMSDLEKSHMALKATLSFGDYETSQLISYSIQDFFYNKIIFQPFWKTLIPFAGLIIPFFSLFRLAKFNLDTRQSESFIGLPTPANTLFLTTFPLLYFAAMNNGMYNAMIFTIVKPIFLIPIILVMSLLLISEIPLFALKFKDFKWSNNQIRFIFLGISLVLIPLLLVWSIPIIIILYLLLSIVSNQIKTK